MQRRKLFPLIIASALISGCGSMIAQSKHNEVGGRYFYDGVQTDLVGASSMVVLPFYTITHDPTNATPAALALSLPMTAFFLADIPFSLTSDTVYSLNLMLKGNPIAAKEKESQKDSIYLCQERQQYRVCSVSQSKCWCEKWRTDVYSNRFPSAQ